ncbi:hypothetical protein Barb4_00361 [Bacteroidales bacterium Barb4]|nr:hypothetical protein Barb4_00361 [Bacteroidales bacterium Barb4]
MLLHCWRCLLLCRSFRTMLMYHFSNPTFATLHVGLKYPVPSGLLPTPNRVSNPVRGFLITFS